VLGYAAQLGIAAFLAGLLQAELPPARSAARSARISGRPGAVLGFALPPLLQLKNVPAVRVIRREGGAEGKRACRLCAGMVVLAALLIWQAGDLTLGGYVVAVLLRPCFYFSYCRGWRSRALRIVGSWEG